MRNLAKCVASGFMSGNNKKPNIGPNSIGEAGPAEKMILKCFGNDLGTILEVMWG